MVFLKVSIVDILKTGLLPMLPNMDNTAVLTDIPSLARTAIL